MLEYDPIARTDAAPALRNTVAGNVVAPGDAGWDMARQAWQLAADQHPVAVVTAADATDVATTVKVAADLGLSVSTQATGHGATGTVDGTVVLRTERLDELSIDLAGRTARVGAGVRWGRLLTALDHTGLLAVAGSAVTTSVVGYLVGGGLSWFSRRHGFAAHGVRALEVVDAYGDQSRVTAEDDPDLFWALRGGGGDFGVVTAVEIGLPDNPGLYGGSLLFPGDDLPRVWEAYEWLTDRAPDDLSAWLSVVNLPHAPTVPAHLRGARMVSVQATYVGAADRGADLLGPLRRAGRPLADTMGAFSLGGLGAVGEEPTDPVLATLDTVLLDDLASPVRDIAAAAMAEPGSPLHMLMVRHLGGALDRPIAGDGAAGSVTEPFLLMAGGFAPSRAALSPIEARLARLLTDLSGHHGGRTLPNFSKAPDGSRIFPGATLTRLQAIKTARDPSGVLRGNHPVLATPAADLTGI